MPAKKRVAEQTQINRSFEDLTFPRANPTRKFQEYAQFIFSRIAFTEGSSYSVLKNRRFYAKGDLSLIALREHAKGDAVFGVALKQVSTGLTKAVCTVLPNSSATEAIDQGRRLLSNYRQRGIDGVLEVCPDDRVRVWAFLSEPVPVKSALREIQSAKKRGFIPTSGGTFPLSDDDVCVEIPPYRDPESRRWSVVMTLEQGESLLEGKTLSKINTNWSKLCGQDRNQEDGFPSYLEATYSDGWDEDLPTHTAGKATPSGETPEVTTAGEGFSCAEEVMHELQKEMTPGDGRRNGRSTAAENGAKGEGFYESTLTPLSESVPTVIGRLLDPAALSIPTPSPILNEILNGGWRLGQFHVLVGSSGSGKSTFCSWIADYTASHKIPVVFVSFQIQREQMAIYALARNARIDSAKIEGRSWLDPDSGGDSNLTKRMIDAGRHYFQTGDYLHLLEADESTSIWEIQTAIRKVRDRAAIEDTSPVLVVVDSLRELKESHSASTDTNESARLDPSLAGLFRTVARQTNSALLLTSGLSRPLNPGDPSWIEMVLGDPEVRPFATLASSVLLLDSSRLNIVTGANLSKSPFAEENRIHDPLDRIVEDARYDPKTAKAMERIRGEYPLNPELAATFSRIVALRNRGGRTRVSAIFRYERALHNFQVIHPDAPSTPAGQREPDEAYAAS